MHQPILYPDIQGNFKFVGYATVSKESQTSTNASQAFGGSNKALLEAFILRCEKDNKACVYLGWGSMTSRSPHYMTEFAVRALQVANQRGIVLGGYAGLGMDCIQDPQLLAYAQENTLFVDRAPHEWLFPRVALTVHHGGSGTTAVALRSGNPTIVTPVFLDQWDHAYLINQLGCGIGYEQTQLQSLSGDELGRAITTVLASPTMIQRAKEIGTQLQTENGAQDATHGLELFWNDYVVTGKFQELFPGKPRKRRSLWVLGVSFTFGGVAVALLGGTIASWLKQ